MLASRLHLNTGKTDLLAFVRDFSSSSSAVPTSALRIGSDLVKLSASVRDLEVYVDADLSMRCHIQKKSCQLLRRFTLTAQYPMVSSNVSIPHARRRSRFVTARLRQCCAGGLTSLPVQPSAVSAQRCCAIHRRPTTLRPQHRHTCQFPLVEGPGAYSVQAGDNRLSFTERHGSSLPGCRSAPFV